MTMMIGLLLILGLQLSCLLPTAAMVETSPPVGKHSHHARAQLPAQLRCASDCGPNGDCYFGKCYCEPGYTGDGCTELLTPANPYYTIDCPNLTPTPKFDINDQRISSGRDCKKVGHGEGTICRFLCFSHPVTGITKIPTHMWHLSLAFENKLWQSVSGDSDRAPEHIESFGHYAVLRGRDLGRMAEVGAGPWTQTRGLLMKLTGGVNVTSVSLLEPNLLEYLKKKDCTYNTGVLAGTGIPVALYPHGSEKLSLLHGTEKNGFDSLLVVNVVEHVQNAYQHFQNIYRSIRPGGLLIFHERYFVMPGLPDTIVLGDNAYHPIRISKVILTEFLANFEALFEQWGESAGMKHRGMKEVGVYYIGIKK